MLYGSAYCSDLRIKEDDTSVSLPVTTAETCILLIAPNSFDLVRQKFFPDVLSMSLVLSKQPKLEIGNGIKQGVKFREYEAYRSESLWVLPGDTLRCDTGLQRRTYFAV